MFVYFVCKLMMSSIFVHSDSILNVENILVFALQKYWLISILIVFDIMASPVLNSELPPNVFALLKYWQAKNLTEFPLSKRDKIP